MRNQIKYNNITKLYTVIYQTQIDVGQKSFKTEREAINFALSVK